MVPKLKPGPAPTVTYFKLVSGATLFSLHHLPLRLFIKVRVVTALLFLSRYTPPNSDLTQWFEMISPSLINTVGILEMV